MSFLFFLLQRENISSAPNLSKQSLCVKTKCLLTCDEVEKSVSETAHFLMQKFNADYSKYNKEKPHFNFVVS